MRDKKTLDSQDIVNNTRLLDLSVDEFRHLLRSELSVFLTELKSEQKVKRNKITCSKKEACGLIGVGMTKLDELLKDGYLEKKNIGRRVLITMTSIERYIDKL